MRRALLKAGRKTAKRWLLLGHRWLGIATGLLFALWIGSGLVMLHVPFPALSEAERLALLAPLPWQDVAVTPDAAVAAAGLSEPPAAFTLESRGGPPVYRLSAPDGSPRTVSARTGALLGAVSPAEAARIVGAVPGTVTVEPVLRDQWTVHGRYDRARPLLKVALHDAAGTELYLSQATGAVVLDTTRYERGWNWLGAVVHWIYPTPLRARPEAWRQVVLWLSGTAVLTALSGVTVGLWRLRLSRRYPNGAATPYRGLARWHHLFGLAAGTALCTFIVSGWLSMNPNGWFSPRTPPADWLAAYAGAPTPIGLDRMALVGLAAPDMRSLRFARIAGHWFVTAASPGATRTRATDGGMPDEVALVSALTRALPGLGAPEVERLTGYDAYWYPNPEPPPLPVLRLRFADPAATWLHLDPANGAILNRLDRSGRAERWLFSALHRLDPPPLGLHPATRTVLQWGLNLLAAVVAATGLLLGWRRLAHALG